MNKYICVRELIFRLSRDVSLGRLCSNSLIASVTTTSRNLTLAPRGCKIACERVYFSTTARRVTSLIWGPPHLCKQALNAFYFSTTARRVTSPTWGPPPPCKQALKKTLAGKVCLKPDAMPSIFSWIRTWPRKRRPPTERNTYEPMASISAASRLNASAEIVV